MKRRGKAMDDQRTVVSIVVGTVEFDGRDV